MGRSVGRSLIANVSFIMGIYLGFKVSDHFMWVPKKFDLIKEQIEVDYWKKYGKPTEIQGEYIKSNVNEGEFYVTYLNEKNPQEKMENIYKLH